MVAANGNDLVIPQGGGLYCSAGDFHIDPWTPAERAVVTHAHSDHARWGSRAYLTTTAGEGPLRARLGVDARIDTLRHGESISIGGVRVSLHPAGHLLGSAQVRLEYGGQVWVISGDYKTQPDPTCEPFEPLRCDVFITESTFGLPIYHWPPQAEVFDEINRWWDRNAERGWTSVIFTYALGKAQRLLAGVDATLGPIGVHGAVMRFVEAYRSAGVVLPEVVPASGEYVKALRGRGLVIAPPSAAATPWLRKFAPVSTAAASGWMQVRGARRWRSLDRGFVLSDHADWDALLATVRATGAERVGTTHGYAAVLSRWLNESGVNAWPLPTRYGEEEEEVGAGAVVPAGEGVEEGTLYAGVGAGEQSEPRAQASGSGRDREIEG